MDNNKNSEKTALLDELESIKELLFEQDDDISDDDIPVLEHSLDPISVDDLKQPEGEDIPLLDIATATEVDELRDTTTADVATLPALQGFEEQTSYYSSEEADQLELDSEVELTTAPPTLEFSEEPEPEPEPEENIEHNLDGNSVPASSELISDIHNQQSLFQQSETAQPVKARGENPFLPKHIRDRLHGNRPVVPSQKIQPLKSQLKTESDRILDDLVSEFLPEIEARLRAQLQPLVQQQLENSQLNEEGEE